MPGDKIPQKILHTHPVMTTDLLGGLIKKVVLEVEAGEGEEADEVAVEAGETNQEGHGPHHTTPHHTTPLPPPLVTPEMDTKATLQDTAAEAVDG